MGLGKWRRAFTLVEMLVVVAIIGILAALMMPSLQSALGAARQIKCANNLKQLNLAADTYVSEYDGKYWDLAYFNTRLTETYTGMPYGKKVDNSWDPGNAPDTLYFCQQNSNPAASIPANYSYNKFLVSYNKYYWGDSYRYFRMRAKVTAPSRVAFFTELNTFVSGTKPWYFGRGSSTLNTGLPQTASLRSPHRNGSGSNVIFVDGHAESISGTLVNSQMGQADVAPSSW